MAKSYSEIQKLTNEVKDSLTGHLSDSEREVAEELLYIYLHILGYDEEDMMSTEGILVFLDEILHERHGESRELMEAARIAQKTTIPEYFG